MRFVLIVVGALAALGLAAFGVVSAQKANGPMTRVASLSPSVPAANTPATTPHASANPVNQLAQATASDAPNVAAAAPPMRVAETAQPQNAAAPAAAPAAAAPNAAAANKPSAQVNTIPSCDKPGGMGLARIVEIDTSGGPGFGFEHFKQYDFLRDKEVVLTFDDGPWPTNTAAVIKALTDQCLKATFFEIGEHASWHPEITKQVIAAGMTVGTHTWSHKDLARNPYASDLEQAKQEIELGNSAVVAAAGGAAVAPFFRFPALQHPAPLLSYLAERNIAIFSTDIDSFDFKMTKPDQVIKSVMSKLEKHGKGIILMHDFRRATGEAMPELLAQLKAGGYKVVHVVPHGQLTTIPKYDDMLKQQDKLSTNNTRPESSVFHTIGENKGAGATSE